MDPPERVVSQVPPQVPPTHNELLASAQRPGITADDLKRIIQQMQNLYPPQGHLAPTDRVNYVTASTNVSPDPLTGQKKTTDEQSAIYRLAGIRPPEARNLHAPQNTDQALNTQNQQTGNQQVGQTGEKVKAVIDATKAGAEKVKTVGVNLGGKAVGVAGAAASAAVDLGGKVKDGVSSAASATKEHGAPVVQMATKYAKQYGLVGATVATAGVSGAYAGVETAKKLGIENTPAAAVIGGALGLTTLAWGPKVSMRLYDGVKRYVDSKLPDGAVNQPDDTSAQGSDDQSDRVPYYAGTDTPIPDEKLREMLPSIQDQAERARVEAHLARNTPSSPDPTDSVTRYENPLTKKRPPSPPVTPPAAATAGEQNTTPTVPAVVDDAHANKSVGVVPHYAGTDILVSDDDLRAILRTTQDPVEREEIEKYLAQKKAQPTITTTQAGTNQSSISPPVSPPAAQNTALDEPAVVHDARSHIAMITTVAAPAQPVQQTESPGTSTAVTVTPVEEPLESLPSAQASLLQGAATHVYEVSVDTSEEKYQQAKQRKAAIKIALEMAENLEDEKSKLIHELRQAKMDVWNAWIDTTEAKQLISDINVFQSDVPGANFSGSSFVLKGGEEFEKQIINGFILGRLNLTVIPNCIDVTRPRLEERYGAWREKCEEIFGVRVLDRERLIGKTLQDIQNEYGVSLQTVETSSSSGVVVDTKPWDSAYQAHRPDSIQVIKVEALGITGNSVNNIDVSAIAPKVVFEKKATAKTVVPATQALTPTAHENSVINPELVEDHRTHDEMYADDLADLQQSIARAEEKITDGITKTETIDQTNQRIQVWNRWLHTTEAQNLRNQLTNTGYYDVTANKLFDVMNEMKSGSGTKLYLQTTYLQQLDDYATQSNDANGNTLRNIRERLFAQYENIFGVRFLNQNLIGMTIEDVQNKYGMICFETKGVTNPDKRDVSRYRVEEIIQSGFAPLPGKKIVPNFSVPYVKCAVDTTQPISDQSDVTERAGEVTTQEPIINPTALAEVTQRVNADQQVFAEVQQLYEAADIRLPSDLGSQLEYEDLAAMNPDHRRQLTEAIPRVRTASGMTALDRDIAPHEQVQIYKDNLDRLKQNGIQPAHIGLELLAQRLGTMNIRLPDNARDWNDQKIPQLIRVLERIRPVRSESIVVDTEQNAESAPNLPTQNVAAPAESTAADTVGQNTLEQRQLFEALVATEQRTIDITPLIQTAGIGSLAELGENVMAEDFGVFEPEEFAILVKMIQQVRKAKGILGVERDRLKKNNLDFIQRYDQNILRLTALGMEQGAPLNARRLTMLGITIPDGGVNSPEVQSVLQKLAVLKKIKSIQ